MNKATRNRIAKKAAATVAKAKSEIGGDGKSLIDVVKEGAAKAKAKSAASTTAGMPALPALPNKNRKKNPKPYQPCSCGCGGQTRSLWVPGHDARARGWALRIERGVCKMGDVPANEQAGAKLMLKLRKDLGTGQENIKIVKGKKAKAEPKIEEAAPAVTESVIPDDAPATDSPTVN